MLTFKFRTANLGNNAMKKPEDDTISGGVDALSMLVDGLNSFMNHKT
jgi:hypothetical protein